MQSNPLSLIAEAVCLYFAHEGNTMLQSAGIALSLLGAIGSSTDSGSSGSYPEAALVFLRTSILVALVQV